MVLMTSLLTGLVAAMLRSLFAVIIVAFLVSATFLVAFFAFGTPIFLFVLTIIGFNGGLILYAVACVIRARARSVH